MSAGSLGDVLGAFVGEVEIRANAIPGAVRIRPAAPSRLGPLLRPEITIRHPRGDVLQVVAPYGAPSSLAGYLFVGGAVLALVGIGFVLGRL